MRPWSRYLLWMALASTVLAAGCRRPAESAEATTPSAAEGTPSSAVAQEALNPATPEPVPVGRHALTASPLATVTDLDRLLGVGFTPEEVRAEIERRGVLRRPDANECAHILRLPRGELLIDAMEAPRNLLSPDAIVIYGRVQAGAPTRHRGRAD